MLKQDTVLFTKWSIFVDMKRHIYFSFSALPSGCIFFCLFWRVSGGGGGGKFPLAFHKSNLNVLAKSAFKFNAFIYFAAAADSVWLESWSRVYCSTLLPPPPPPHQNVQIVQHNNFCVFAKCTVQCCRSILTFISNWSSWFFQRSSCRMLLSWGPVLTSLSFIPSLPSSHDLSVSLQILPVC